MSHDVEARYEIYQERRRRAVKMHACDACDEPIAVGHTYWAIFILFEGEPERVKRCERCQALHEHLREIGECDQWPDERLACGLDYEEHWYTPPPADVAELAFLTPTEMQLQCLRQRISDRFLVAEQLAGGSAEHRRAYQDLSRLMEQMARYKAADDDEGQSSRWCAVASALIAGDHRRAVRLRADYFAEALLPEEVREEITAMLRGASS